MFSILSQVNGRRCFRQVVLRSLDAASMLLDLGNGQLEQLASLVLCRRYYQ